MDAAAARRFGDDWVRAWNDHDLDALMVHFADDVVFTSPVADRLVPGSGGRIHGRDALREYYAAGLTAIPGLRFDIVGVYAGVDTMVINYRNQDGALVNEVLGFDAGLVVSGHGTYLVARAGSRDVS
jgi:hypothetical protein